MFELFFLVVAIILAVKIIRWVLITLANAVKPTPPRSKEKNEVDAYNIYLTWCAKQQYIPIDNEAFAKLADENGKISVTNLMQAHNLINPTRNTDSSVTKNAHPPQNDGAEQKKRDDAFVVSTLAGYYTNSTFLGTIIGGNLLGGIFGDYLNKKPKK